MTKTVHAVRRGESLELLEPLDVPEGTELALTIEIPLMPAQVVQFCLPIRSLGPIKGTLGREDIYGAAG
jgi:hypothetical protein